MKNVAKQAIVLAALIGLAQHSVLAQSNVTFYGQIDSFVGATKAAGTSNRAYVLGAGGLQTSYWGFKGTEDLGDGLRAIFDLNGFYRTDTGALGRSDTDAMFTRNAYVGLQDSSWGSVRMGRNTTPYFLSTILFNPLVDSYNFSPSVFLTYKTATNGKVYDPGIIGDSGWSNSVIYTTPTWSGFSASAIYAFGEQAGATGKNKWGGNMMYVNGPFGATIALQQTRFNNVPGDVTTPAALVGFGKQRAAQGGISYDFGLTKLFAQVQYINSEISSTSGDIRHRNGQIGTSIPVGNGNVLLSYGYAKASNNSSEFRRNTLGLAYDYYLSKRTELYASYFYDKVSDVANGDTLGFGIRHRF